MVQFFFKFIFLYSLTYIFIGTFYFHFFTKSYYSQFGEFSGYLITLENKEAWDQIIAWMIPIQTLRSFLLALVIYPLWKFISNLSFLNRFLILWSYLWIACGIASDLPAPGNLEGILYMDKKITWKIHLVIFSEIIIQSFVFSFLFLRWLDRCK